MKFTSVLLAVVLMIVLSYTVAGTKFKRTHSELASVSRVLKGLEAKLNRELKVAVSKEAHSKRSFLKKRGVHKKALNEKKKAHNSYKLAKSKKQTAKDAVKLAARKYNKTKRTFKVKEAVEKRERESRQKAHSTYKSHRSTRITMERTVKSELKLIQTLFKLLGSQHQVKKSRKVKAKKEPVKFCHHVNGKGRCFTAVKSDNWVGHHHNDNVSYIKVPAKAVVTIYMHANYKGKNKTFKGPKRVNLTKHGFNNHLSSFKIRYE